MHTARRSWTARRAPKGSKRLALREMHISTTAVMLRRSLWRC